MPSTSCARYRSKNSVTTAAADSAVRGRWLTSVMVASPGLRRSRSRRSASRPGLIDIQVLLLVDGAGVASGLGSLRLEQRGDHVAGGDHPADGDHQVGE